MSDDKTRRDAQGTDDGSETKIVTAQSLGEGAEGAEVAKVEADGSDGAGGADGAGDSLSAAASAEASPPADSGRARTPEENMAKASQDSGLPLDDPHIDNDTTRVTGRPVFTKEDNESFRHGGARFFRRAMESRSNAMGEEYSPYRIPPQMRSALRRIDREAALQKAREQALAEGRDPDSVSEDSLAHSDIESLHAADPEEEEKTHKAAEESERIAHGGARFYGRYKQMLERQSEQRESTGMKLKRNVRLAFIVLVALGGYIIYRDHFSADEQAQTLSDLKASLPLSIDAHTTMVRIDDRNDEFKFYFEKDPKAFAGQSADQIEASLEKVAENAPLLCNNPLLHNIVSSGHKVTVLLDATDGSFRKSFSVDKCPDATSAAQGTERGEQL